MGRKITESRALGALGGQSMLSRHLTVLPITGALGAELRGLDITKPLGATQLQDLRSAIAEHSVVFLRDQAGLSVEQHLELAKLFGKPEPHPIVKGLASHPDILQWTKEAGKPTDFGESWHTDNSYQQQPTAESLLYSLEVPPYGNDTLWASTYAAWDGLSDGLKRMLESLNAVHSPAKAFSSDNSARADRFEGKEGERQYVKSEALTTEVIHPVCRIHPVTGKKILYVNSMFTLRFEGMTEEESTPLLQYLYHHIAKPEYQCRFRWTPDTLTIWDNRCTQHLAINDNFTHKRTMRRATIQGERPVGLAP